MVTLAKLLGKAWTLQLIGASKLEKYVTVDTSNWRWQNSILKNSLKMKFPWLKKDLSVSRKTYGIF